MRGAPIGAHRQCCGTAAWPRHTRSNGREERPAAWKWCTAHHGTRLDVSHSSVRSRIGRRRRRWPASRRLEYWRLLLQRAENCEPDRLRRKWRSGEKGSATVCLLHIQNSKSRLKCVVDGKPLGWNIAESVATTAAARLAGGNLSHFSGQLWRGYGRHYGARQMRRSAARWSLC